MCRHLNSLLKCMIVSGEQWLNAKEQQLGALNSLESAHCQNLGLQPNLGWDVQAPHVTNVGFGVEMRHSWLRYPMKFMNLWHSRPPVMPSYVDWIWFISLFTLILYTIISAVFFKKNVCHHSKIQQHLPCAACRIRRRSGLSLPSCKPSKPWPWLNWCHGELRAVPQGIMWYPQGCHPTWQLKKKKLNGCLWLGNKLSTVHFPASHVWLQEGKASAINHPPILPETNPMQIVQTIPRL